MGQVNLVGLGSTPGTVILAEEPDGQDVLWKEVAEGGVEPKEIMVGASVDLAFFDENTRQFVG